MRERIDRKRSRSTILAVIAGLLVGAVAISPALGGPGFLTTQKAKKIFITKTKAKKTYLPLHHSIRQMVSTAEWVATDPAIYVDYASGSATLSADSATQNFFDAALDIPQTIQGKILRLKSFELCYETSPNATIDEVFLFKVSNVTATNVQGTTSNPIQDNTHRTDSTCRTYAGASPVTIRPNDSVQVVVLNEYSGAGQVTIYRLSLNLKT